MTVGADFAHEEIQGAFFYPFYFTLLFQNIFIFKMFATLHGVLVSWPGLEPMPPAVEA